MTDMMEDVVNGGTGAAVDQVRTVLASLAGQGAQVHGLDLKDLERLPAGVSGHPVVVTSEESVVAAVRALYAGDDRPVDLVNSAGIVENVPYTGRRRLDVRDDVEVARLLVWLVLATQ